MCLVQVCNIYKKLLSALANVLIFGFGLSHI